jgi:RND superfamily putative drug exporter
MSRFLYRLGHFSVRHRRWMLGFWLALLVGLGVAASAAGGTTTNKFALPGTESQQAFDLLDARFPAQSGSTATVVFAAPQGSTIGASTGAIQAALGHVNGQEGVRPFDPAASLVVSPDGTVAYAQVSYVAKAQAVPHAAVDRLEQTIRDNTPTGVTVSFGGDVITAANQDAGHTSELIGLAVAVVVLVIAFGSVLAMGLPLATALIGVGIGVMGITLMSAFVDLSSTAPILAIMIGLAVGIDYALFIVTRHRQNLADGHDIAESIARSNATAGGAVVFAGMTVVIALASLAVVGIPFLTVMGVAAAVTVAVAVAIAVTLMPALLGFAGHNIDRFKVPGFKARTGGTAESANTFSARWSRNVTRRPGLALAAGLAVMGVLAIPLLSMRLGMTDAGTDAPKTTTRQSYDTLATGFGPGFNGPLTLVVDLTAATDRAGALDALTAAVKSDRDVVQVGQAVLSPNGDTAIVKAIPASAPAAQATTQLVHRLRDHVVPAIESATGSKVYVSGTTAANIDISDKLGAALPTFMAVVIGLTMLLLLVVFRSVLVPIKAAIAILLSIGGAFGVVVAVFQWGWLNGLVGMHEGIPIVSFLPITMFAILFGLSMDYEVFILSRIREDYAHTGHARHSVLTGLTASARVITAAALIMISVFASFILGDNAIIKMFGIGLSAAVLLDATVVRMVIVPATMALFDKAAWWLPRWLDRLLPNIDIEGEHLIVTLDTPAIPDSDLAALVDTESTLVG